MTNNEKVIQWIEQAASKISDFAVEHIPPFIQEYLTWKFWEAAVYTGCHLIPVISALILYVFHIKKLWNWSCEQADYTDGLSRLVPIGLTVILAAVTIGTFPIQHIMDMIQIAIAPKVYILEQASQLVKEQ
jgi:hypothetical protein